MTSQFPYLTINQAFNQNYNLKLFYKNQYQDITMDKFIRKVKEKARKFSYSCKKKCIRKKRQVTHDQSALDDHYKKTFRKININEYDKSSPSNAQMATRLVPSRTDPVFQKKMPLNYVKTQKYTILTFLPKFLYMYFSQFTNVYFLIMTIMFLIPAISPFANWRGASPFIFICLLGMVREAIEDIIRYIRDRTANKSQCMVIRDNWMQAIGHIQLKCGDLVLIKKDEILPADILI